MSFSLLLQQTQEIFMKNALDFKYSNSRRWGTLMACGIQRLFIATVVPDTV